MIQEANAAPRDETDPADERELLLSHRDGDPSAFSRLVARYRAPVYSYLVRCGVRESDRDDVFQDIFIKVHCAAAQFQSERPLHPWLFTIVANTVRTHHRKQRVKELVFMEPRREVQDPAPHGERVAVARQTATWLEEAIRKLPLMQREVLVLACIENLAQKDIAAALELPLNTVKTHLRRARLTLVRMLARRNAVLQRESS
jgi:RNA polymerase sigma-70 factor (ECF subfamily)